MGAAWGVSAKSFEDTFAIVFIDSPTEAQFGEFPVARKVVAQGVNRAAELGARAVVLKFFYDQPKDEADDAALEQAMKRIPVLIQARVDDAEADPQPLLPRFHLPGRWSGKTVIEGQNGWIPRLRFQTNAHSVGFVDLGPGSVTNVALLERYRGRAVKSLSLAALEVGAGTNAVLESGRRVRLGPATLAMDSQQQVAVAPLRSDELPFHSFGDLANGRIPREKIAGKVVLIGYDGDKLHSLETPGGPVPPHRFFVLQLRELWNQLEATRRAATP
jgi:CHASE2 domain-containing sensor protein